MSVPAEFDMEYVAETEKNCVVKTFNADVAWEIGLAVRKTVAEKYPGISVKIDICTAGGEQMFHSVIGDGTNPDNDNWVRRKRNTVLQYNRSSFFIGRKLAAKQKSLLEANYRDEKDFATHGGGVPIFVPNVHGLVGVLTISGLAQHQDHMLAVETLAGF